jgi:hypothetical protein
MPDPETKDETLSAPKTFSVRGRPGSRPETGFAQANGVLFRSRPSGIAIGGGAPTELSEPWGRWHWELGSGRGAASPGENLRRLGLTWKWSITGNLVLG